MGFSYFDPKGEMTITYRRLPHWEQTDKTYFITFRTADSMPEEIIGQWCEERDGWLRRHGIEPRREGWHIAFERLSPAVRYQYHAEFSERFHQLLDGGHGECPFRRPELADMVARSLLHFDGQRYFMGDFVVMPNHVHLLVQFSGAKMLKRQCRSWKKYTAGEINKKLGRQGHFWQAESYDHLVRSPEEFWHYREYIADNPKKARLRAGEFLYYRSPRE